MRKATRIIVIMSIFVMAVGISNAKNDLPLSDNIKILNVTPYGEKTRNIFEIQTDDFSYENLFRLIQQKIQRGYKPDCNCEFDNDYLLSLNCQEVLEIEQLRQPVVFFKRKTTWKGYHSWDETFYVHLCISNNMKFVGLEFITRVGEYSVGAEHFVLLNSKGVKLWELPYKEVKVWTEKEQIQFPSDSNPATYDLFRVSNVGRVLQVHSTEIEGFGAAGWSLYDTEGKLLKESKIRSYSPTFSNDGDRFLVREGLIEASATFRNKTLATACYDERGKLLWRKPEILPLPVVDYISSTTGKYFLAGYRLGEGPVLSWRIDWCIIDKNGNIISRRNYPEAWMDARIRVHGITLTDDPVIYYMSGIKGKMFNRKFGSNKLFETKREEYGRMISEKLLPLTEKYFIAAGYMRSDSTRKYDPLGSYKFFAIIDKDKNLQGLKIIDTKLTNNRTFRLKVDKKARKFYLYTNDVSIEAQFDPEKGLD